MTKEREALEEEMRLICDALQECGHTLESRKNNFYWAKGILYYVRKAGIIDIDDYYYWNQKIASLCFREEE